jgi:photosystem II stability/assembly factor-like uncharacterized protein
MRTSPWFFGLALLGLPSASVAADDTTSGPGFDAATFEGLELRSLGPAFMSGRISDLVIDPTDTSTWYAGVGSGGIFKTVNAGTTWTPIFEDEDAYSIGCLTLDPNDPDVVWVGTGENNSGRHVGYGAGVYRSPDGGKSWSHMGLPDSQHIGMIRVDPRDSDTVFVAAQGPLWSGGGDRGLFKSTDGGGSWRKVLGDGLGRSKDDDAYTGVSEVHLDPHDPDVMYAVSWQRLRNVAVLMDGGPGSGIHKSTDGGETWTRLTGGLPKGDLGKTGLAISPQDPDVVYATIELDNRTGGFWRSEDGGASWDKRSDYVSSGTGPHYYQELFASPHVFDRVYQMDVHLHVTHDVGSTFERLQHDSKHVDHHAMAFTDDPDHLLVGNDGGVYESFDLGTTWRYSANLPITQYYKVAVDYDEPFYNIYGGTQDNNSQGGPSRTMNANGIRDSDWFVTLGGDGHQSAVDPTNPDIVYAEWQQGNLTRFDRRTGESVYIKPQPAADEPPDRFNWDSPVLVSPHDPSTLFFASQRVWRSDDHGDSWTPISGDLTRDQERVRAPVMGRAWGYDAPWDLYAMSQFNTITSLSQSPLDPQLLYVGTDDGLIRVTEDGGETWSRVDRLPKVPQGFFVNDIKADLHDPDTVYVVVDDHKHGDLSPYVLKSTDRGRRWTSIAGNLPERHILWRLVQDHEVPELLFLGSEFGVFFTVDGGGAWTKLTGGVPNIPFRDLAIQQREDDLVGATFGRGFYVFDDYAPLRSVTQEMLERDTVLFEVRRAHWYVPRRPLGCGTPGCVGSQGDATYTAPNPDFGAVFTYYLPDDLRTAKAERKRAEKDATKAGEDVAFPAWDDLRAEGLEQDPAIVLTVRDADGAVVRHVVGPTSAGFHRVSWDLTHPPLDPWSPGKKGDDDRPGVLVVPGTYSVSMARVVDGTFTPYGQSQTFEVVPVRDPTFAPNTQEQRVVFESEVYELTRAVDGTHKAIDAVLAELDAVEDVLPRTRDEGGLFARVDALRKGLAAQRDRLVGRPTDRTFRNPEVVTVQSRLWHAGFRTMLNAHGPTPAQRESLAIARSTYDQIVAQLQRLVDGDYTALKQALDDAKAPWTPGRGIQR